MISIQGVSKQYGSKVLFEGASATLAPRSRIALIGPNGAGKSTLIRMILEQESPDAGRVVRFGRVQVGHLAQEPPALSDQTVLLEVLRLGGVREALLSERGQLEERLAADAERADPAVLDRYAQVMERLEALDEYRLESRARAILGGMGFSAGDLERPLRTFSGGWLMRVALARLLLQSPEVLLLDEPTNHLDLESLLWLEDFLQSYPGAILVVSHDRAFLNRLANEVWEIDQRRLEAYRGNLDGFAEQKAERLAVLMAQAEKEQSRIAELERFIERFGAKATKARQAQSRAKELEKIQENRVELPQERSTVRFRFPPAPHSGREVATLRQVKFGYGEKTIYRDFSWILQRGSRVAITGINGAGKTTLLKLLSGTVAPTGGEHRLGHLVEVGFYAQHQAEQLRLDWTVLQELERAAPEMNVSQVRAIAGAFLFTGDAVDKKCAVLSGGEKARVALAKLLLQPSNFLLLDEPTNHLDADSKRVLRDALEDYDGTLVLVSHDREFVSGLCTSVLEIVPDAVEPALGSRVVPHVVGYEDWLERKQAELREKSRSLSGGAGASGKGGEAVAESARPKRTGPSNNQLQAWKKELEKIEGEIARLESGREGLSSQLSDPAVYADKSRAAKLMEDQRRLEADLEARFLRWEELSTQLAEAGR